MTRMRHFMFIGLLALIAVGCGEPPGSTRAEATRIWRSPDCSLEQKADAAATLIPAGANVEAIRSILGQNGQLTHSHGPSFSAAGGGTNVPDRVPYFDQWTVEYGFPGGGVSLELGKQGGFVRAATFRTPVSIPLTN